MNIIKNNSIVIILICFFFSSCATNKSPYKSDNDTHFYTSDLNTTVESVESVMQQSGMDIISTKSTSENSFQMSVVLNAYGVSESDRVQLYSASVSIKRIENKVTKVHINDRRKRPATVSSTDVKDYGSDLLRKFDKKLTLYKPEPSSKN